MTKFDTAHKQVHFRTLDGENTEVDEGMLDVLVELRRLGVRTQYSCQGDGQAAYFLSDRKSCLQLVKRMRRLNKAGHYSPASWTMIEHFIHGYRAHEFNHFKVYSHKYSEHTVIESVLERSFSRGEKTVNGYSMEWMYSRHFGARAAVRWPKGAMTHILQLLHETPSK